MGANIAPAPQPGLRSYIIYTELPAGCVAFEVPDDEAMPHLRAGEFAVLDPEDRDPAEGELFVITWKSDIDQRKQIVRMDLRFGRYGKRGDPSSFGERYMWMIGGIVPKRMMNLAGQHVGEPLRWADGPWDDTYCREICHGKIVGIYEPDFRKQLRLAA